MSILDLRPARLRPYAAPLDNGLQIAYQDASFLAVDKPCGLLAVPGRTTGLQDCMAARVCQRYPNALVVHRLDEATSGLMVFALNPVMQRALGCAFEQRLVEKTYIAVVQGCITNDVGVIDAPLAADWPRRPLQRVDVPHGKPAITRWQVMHRDTLQGTTRVQLHPQTGRTHQLRVHMQAMGHPICGDLLYRNMSSLSSETADRLMLHAKSLRFVHPLHHHAMCIDTATPF